MDQPPLNGTERAVLGAVAVEQVRQTLDRYLQRHAGAGLDEVLFRAGRIDAVWAVRIRDGRDVVVKAHRPPVDLVGRRAAVQAQRLLLAAGFPCPEQISGPDAFEGLVLSVESLVRDGEVADARDPRIRRSGAAGLAAHVQILRRHPELLDVAGPGPAWCRYQAGPWPVPHDTIFDFSCTPPGYAWLDQLAQEAADRLVGADHSDPVVGHADWYVNNLRFDGGRLVAAFDWDLCANPEPVLVGLSAGGFTASGTSGYSCPSVAEVVGFAEDYESAAGRRFGEVGKRAVAAATTWVLAFNARCELALLTGDPHPRGNLTALAEHGLDYLELRW